MATGDPMERAFRTPEQIEDYYNNDKIFKQCPMHPKFQEKTWTLKYTGEPPRIKQQAYENYDKFLKKQFNQEKQRSKQSKFAKKTIVSPKSNKRVGRFDTEEDQGRSRVFSAEPATKMDKITLAQARMMAKQSGIKE